MSDEDVAHEKKQKCVNLQEESSFTRRDRLILITKDFELLPLIGIETMLLPLFFRKPPCH